MFFAVGESHKEKPKLYMTTIEAAEALGVSVRTIRSWTQSGRLKSKKKIGGCSQSQTLVLIESVKKLALERLVGGRV